MALNEYSLIIKYHLKEIYDGGSIVFYRKLTKALDIFNRVLSLIFFGTLTIPFVVICIVFLKPFFKIRLGEIESRVFGHFVLAPEIYLSEIDAGIHGGNSKTIDIFYLNKKVTNGVVEKIWNKKFNIFPRIIIEPTHKLLLNFFSSSKHLVPFRHWRNNWIWQTYDLHNIMPKTSCHLTFSKEELSLGSKYFLRKGIVDEDFVVCFYARSGKYYSDCSLRNSSISIQYDAIKYLASIGIKCIRVGSDDKSPISIYDKNIIDYSASDETCNLLDLLIQKRSNFMISTGSGVDSVSHAFRKPTLYVNLAEWYGIERYCNYQVPIFVPKLYRWRKDGSYLKFDEIIQTRANRFSFPKDLNKLGIFQVDNTPEEVLKATIEMYMRVNKSWVENDEDIKIQKKFQTICFSKEINPNYFPKVSSFFLKRYKFLL